MKAAVKAITDGKGELGVRIVQLVRLLREGEPVIMSKRASDSPRCAKCPTRWGLFHQHDASWTAAHLAFAPGGGNRDDLWIKDFGGLAPQEMR